MPYTYDYSGASVPSGLAAGIGSTDLTFTIQNASTWLNLWGYELGTGPTGSGSFPFFVAVDYGTANEELVLCSAVNNSTGVVTVATSGRGAAGTTAIAHSANAVCVPVFSAVQGAFYDSAAGMVAALSTGGRGSIIVEGAATYGALTLGTNGQALVSNGTDAVWGSGLTANPAASIYNGTATSIASSWTQVVSMASTRLDGGMTLSGNGIKVPVAGDYLVDCSVLFASGTGIASISTAIYQNGSLVKQWSGNSPSSTSIPSVGGTALLRCAANDVITLYAQSGSARNTTPSSSCTWLDAYLVSV